MLKMHTAREAHFSPKNLKQAAKDKIQGIENIRFEYRVTGAEMRSLLILYS